MFCSHPEKQAPFRAIVAPCLLIAGALAWPGAAAYAVEGTPAPVQFSDGATGIANASCGAGDECATLTLKNGDRVVLYNAGASHCKPYQLRVVRFHGEQVLFSSEQQTDKNNDSSGPFGTTCGAFKTTVLTLANGHRLTINQQADGTLFARWDGAPGSANGSAAHEAVAYEHPSICLVRLGFLTATVKWSDKPCVEARNFLRSEQGIRGDDEPVEMTEGHPKRCATGDTRRVQIWFWDKPECAAARERWTTEHAPAASPTTSPHPS
jgi:hypothetical protein